MEASTYNLSEAVARNSGCAFHWPPRNGDAGICSRPLWKRRKGWRMKLSARSAAWLLPLVLCACVTKPSVAQISPRAADRRHASAQARAWLPRPCPLRTQHSQTKEPRSCSARAGEDRPSTQIVANRQPRAGQLRHLVRSPGRLTEAPPTPASLPKRAPAASLVPRRARIPKQTENSIDEVERGLNGIARKLNDQETKTSTQIREFLKQARDRSAGGRCGWRQNTGDQGQGAAGELQP